MSGNGEHTREELEARIADLENRLRAHERGAPFAEFDPQGNFIEVNEELADVFGYGPNWFIGKSNADLVGSDEDARRATDKLLRDARGDREARQDFTMIASDGSERTIEVAISAVSDATGAMTGYVARYRDRSEAAKGELEAQALASMINGAESMFMCCDTDLRITYANPAVMEMLRKYEAQIRRELPAFDISRLMGTCIDDFHADPSHQRRLLGDERNLPARTELQLGDLIFGVNATALHDAEGNFIGNGVEWMDYNSREEYRREVQRLTESAREGQLDVRGDVGRMDDVYRPMLESINEIVDTMVAPILEASDALTKLAQQDLTARMTGDYRGEFAEVRDNLNGAIESLDKALQQVGASTDQVSSSTSQIAEGNDKLARGSSTQASSVEQISASLEQMSSSTNQNATNAAEATKLSEVAKTAAERGTETMQKMSEAIRGIKASSDETARIVKTIDEIAFQTNLLALNAAVEAARAGDGGKGFAVVAEEVRSLAQRSAEAAKNTAQLIEEAIKKADGGVAISEDVSNILDEICGGSTKVNNLISEIASASSEQAEGIAQISTAVDQVNQVTQENAASSEESSAASSELSSEVQRLASLIAQFQLSAARASAAPAMAPPTMAAPVHRPRTATASASKASHAIPFDDSEFNDPNGLMNF